MYKTPGCGVSQESDNSTVESPNIKVTLNGHEITISIPTHWSKKNDR